MDMNLDRCDMTMDLRIVGHGHPSIHVSTDEGDGVEFTKMAGPEPSPEHYEAWAAQVEYLLWWLQAKAKG